MNKDEYVQFLEDDLGARVLKYVQESLQVGGSKIEN